METQTPLEPGKQRLHTHLFILSAPSGAGKTTLRKVILKTFPDILYSVSYTTRAPRHGELDGVDYHFIDQKAFQEKLERGLWAEWARVHDHYYGTCAAFLDNGLSEGHDVLLDIDVQGTLQILQRYPDSVTIFIMPPSLEVLKQRLESRGTDSPQQIAQRLHSAENEMTFKERYRHIIVNDRLEKAVDDITAVIRAYRGNPL